MTLNDLPGKKAHVRMAPVQRVADYAAESGPPAGARDSAVLVLLIPANNGAAASSLMDWRVVLIKRNTYEGIHSGQIAFPGGKWEKEDKNITDTAYREAFEELGIKREHTETICRLSHIYIPPSNFNIYPVLAVAKDELRFEMDPREVVEYREIEIRMFNPDSSEMRRLETLPGEFVDAPGFVIDDYFVWGATAMILSELYQLVAEAKLSISLSKTYISSSNPSI